MKKFITSFYIVVLSLLLSVGIVSAAGPTPSTNGQNRINGWAHVDQLSKGVGTTELKFISTRAFASCFEYRTDGNTGQKTSNTNYNTDILDGLYPYYCQNNNNSTHTINANGYVEVRMVFGAEADERFDWTRFDVIPSPTETPAPTPTNTPSNSGGTGTGDGLSDGRSDGRSDGGSSSPQGTAVLGASTFAAGKQGEVLGASTFAGTGTFETSVMNFMLLTGMMISGAGLLSYAKEKKA